MYVCYTGNLLPIVILPVWGLLKKPKQAPKMSQDYLNFLMNFINGLDIYVPCTQ